MDSLIIGLRSQDIHESLKNTAAFGPKEVHYKKTLLIGKAAALAMHLRGLLYIKDYVQLEYAAASLGISSIELPTVLHELEEIDFISGELISAFLNFARDIRTWAKGGSCLSLRKLNRQASIP
jgi:hypothetical protein